MNPLWLMVVLPLLVASLWVGLWIHRQDDPYLDGCVTGLVFTNLVWAIAWRLEMRARTKRASLNRPKA